MLEFLEAQSHILTLQMHGIHTPQDVFVRLDE
jgi:hypothetical protein